MNQSFSNSTGMKNYNQEDIIVGLDIGTTKICVLVGRKNEHNKFEILGIGKANSTGVSRGMVSNVNQTVEAIIQATQQAEQNSGIAIDKVFVGIAGQHIKSMHHRHAITIGNTDEVISQKDLQRMFNDVHRLKMQPGERIIHALPQEFTVDGEMGNNQPIGMFGHRLEANFHIITGQISAAQNIERCIHQAGLKMSGMVLEPIASSASVLSVEDKEAGVCLVDIGGGTTDVAIFYDGIIRHTAVIPFGGNVITDDIKEGCRIMKSQAEALKCQRGSALAIMQRENHVVALPGVKGLPAREISLKNLAGIIQARVEEIIDLVYFQIKTSGYQKKLVGGIVLTGGGSNLKDIKHLVEVRTGLDVRIGLPIEHLANARESAIKNPMYATGIGLIMTGHEAILMQRQEDEMMQRETNKIVEEPKIEQVEIQVEQIQPVEPIAPVEQPKQRPTDQGWYNKFFGNIPMRVEKFLLEGNDVKKFED
ncbi:MAG: cell division protein FtsA [Chitinophagales bacterium]|nr:cell division protein FtsA [Chitinophagales bacterium]